MYLCSFNYCIISHTNIRFSLHTLFNFSHHFKKHVILFERKLSCKISNYIVTKYQFGENSISNILVFKKLNEKLLFLIAFSSAEKKRLEEKKSSGPSRMHCKIYTILCENYFSEFSKFKSHFCVG